MQVTDDETRFPRNVFHSASEIWACLSASFLSTLSGLSFQRDRRETYVVFSEGFMTGGIATYELRSHLSIGYSRRASSMWHSMRLGGDADRLETAETQGMGRGTTLS